MQDKLGFPDKQGPAKWSNTELNDILHRKMVPCRNGLALYTFGCLEWESELCSGVMQALFYSFNMPKRRFHNMNPQAFQSFFYHGMYIGYPTPIQFIPYLSHICF